MNKSTIHTQANSEFIIENHNYHGGNGGAVVLTVAGYRHVLTMNEALALANYIRLNAELLSSPAYDY